jgi:FkbM family methyltransferase
MTELVQLGGDLDVYTQSPAEAQYMYDEIFAEGCYREVGLPARPYVVDVGGNIGMFVLYIKREYPDAEVVSFEPMPNSIELFGRNMALHGVTGVTLHPTALGSVPEEAVTFSFYPLLPANSTRYPEIKELPKSQLAEKTDRTLAEQIYYADEVTVPVKRLAEFLPPGRTVDLLKVDVEGAEADVLLGIDDEQWPFVQRAVVEVADLDGQLERVCDILRVHGFEVEARQAPLTEEDNHYFMVYATR